MKTRPDMEIDDGEFPVLPPGAYPFEVTKAEAEVSEKKGFDMIALTLKVSGQSKEVLVWDRLVDTENAEWKTRAFCKAVGLEDRYKRGGIEPIDCLGCRGMVRLNKEPSYRDKDVMTNTVNRYLHTDKELAEATGTVLGVPPSNDDDIPF